MGTCCPRALRCVPLCHVTLRGGDRLEEGGSTSSAPQHEIDERPNHRVSFFFVFLGGGGGVAVVGDVKDVLACHVCLHGLNVQEF